MKAIQALQTMHSNGGGMTRIAADTWAAPRRPEVTHSEETVAELVRRGLAVMCGKSSVVMVEAGRLDNAVVTHAVEDMWGVLVSRALADKVRKHGGDVDKHQTVIDRRAVFVTTEEYRAIVAEDVLP